MWNTFRYTVLSVARERSIIIWVLLFPLILATLFNAMFGSIDENAYELDAIPVAFVDESEGEAGVAFNTMMDALSDGDEALLAPIDAKNHDEALGMLKDGKAVGIITLDAKGWPSLELSPASGDMGISMEQIRRTILADLMDDFCRSREAIEDIVKNDLSLLQDPKMFATLMQRTSHTKELTITHSKTKESVRYFYALLGFAAFMAANVGLSTVEKIQPNVSPLGARRAIGGTSKAGMLAGSIAASWCLSFVALLVAFGYIRFVLGIQFGGREGECILGLAVAALMATAFGALIGALPHVPSGAKSGILTAATCLLSLFAGLYGTPAMNLADQVAREAPWAAAINPVKQVSDLFYSLYVYNDLTPFYQSLAILAALTAAFALVSALLMRRQRYASL